jgi:REP element-mobilizing transposase RayT
MSRPPRIPNWLRWEQNTIYFVTFCVEKRKPVLATDQAWKICRLTFEKLNQWTILGAIAMPDHIHLLAAPMDREASVAGFAKWFKRWFNSAYRDVKASQSEQLAWQWQEGAFDRLLRSHESLTGKWEYIRQNPVRAGLVADPDDWPYQLQFDASRR